MSKMVKHCHKHQLLKRQIFSLVLYKDFCQNPFKNTTKILVKISTKTSQHPPTSSLPPKMPTTQSEKKKLQHKNCDTWIVGTIQYSQQKKDTKKNSIYLLWKKSLFVVKFTQINEKVFKKKQTRSWNDFFNKKRKKKSGAKWILIRSPF